MRAAIALKRSADSVRLEAREFGTPFSSKRQLKLERRERESGGWSADGLSSRALFVTCIQRIDRERFDASPVNALRRLASGPFAPSPSTPPRPSAKLPCRCPKLPSRPAPGSPALA